MEVWNTEKVLQVLTHTAYCFRFSVAVAVAGEPTSLEAVISKSNSSHVNVTVSWESPADPVTGYVIYYQTKGGPVISDMVSGGETETHSLDGLQRGVTYYISILALSQHLPSPLVGNVTVVGESFPSSSSHHVLLSLFSHQRHHNLYSQCFIFNEPSPYDNYYHYQCLYNSHHW